MKYGVSKYLPFLQQHSRGIIASYKGGIIGNLQELRNQQVEPILKPTIRNKAPGSLTWNLKKEIPNLETIIFRFCLKLWEDTCWTLGALKHLAAENQVKQPGVGPLSSSQKSPHLRDEGIWSTGGKWGPYPDICRKQKATWTYRVGKKWPFGQNDWPSILTVGTSKYREPTILCGSFPKKNQQPNFW